MINSLYRKLAGPFMTGTFTTLSLLFITKQLYRMSVDEEFELESLDGKIIVLTGGCRGIGYETLKKLSEKNAKIIVGCRSNKLCKKNIEKLKTNDNIDHQILDLESFNSVTSFANYISASYGHIDTLINNAGIYISNYRTSRDGLLSIFQVNAFSPLLLTLKLLPLLKKSQNGQILNVGCRGPLMMSHLDLDYITGKEYLSKKTRYFLSKNLLLVQTHQLAKLLGPNKVRINFIDPGHARTSFYKESPLYFFLIVPLYYLLFSSAEEASVSLLNVIAAKKYSNMTNKLFFLSRPNTMPDDLVANVTPNRQVWNYMLERFQMRNNDVLRLIDY